MLKCWTLLKWSLNQNTTIFMRENELEMSNWRSFVSASMFSSNHSPLWGVFSHYGPFWVIMRLMLQQQQLNFNVLTLLWHIILHYILTHTPSTSKLRTAACLPNHWNENVVILMKFSSLAALEVVILTTFSAASDENFIKMKTFPFQWWYHKDDVYVLFLSGIYAICQ